MMKTRRTIGLETNVVEMVSIMSEGNPGALNVLVKLMKNPIGFTFVLSLDDMNIRGSQIWLGYKDVCKEDINLFIEKIKNRDQEMVNYINSHPRDSGTYEVAVASGASFTR